MFSKSAGCNYAVRRPGERNAIPKDWNPVFFSANQVCDNYQSLRGAGDRGNVKPVYMMLGKSLESPGDTRSTPADILLVVGEESRLQMA